MRLFFTTTTAAVLLALPLTAADPPAAGNDAALKKMRDTLRATMTQLQTAEAEKATLLADKTALEGKVKELGAALEKATKQAAKDQADAQAKTTQLETRLTEQQVTNKALGESLEKWKKAAEQQAALAQSTEDKRAAQEVKATELQRKVEDRERKNLELYKTGMEVLQRYRDFSYGGALRAREPFTGITRAKLEGLVQGYADQLADAKLKPGSQPKSEPQPKPAR